MTIKLGPVIAAAALVTSISAASAADMPVAPYAKAAPIVAPIYNWGGLYIGLNGGGGWARKCWDLTNNLGVVVNPALAEGCHDASGGTVGGQVGYRWQAGTWVFGLEGQGTGLISAAQTPTWFLACTIAMQRFSALVQRA